MIIKQVTSQPLLDIIKEVFREYQVSLGIDLSFQSFELELSSLPGKYEPPRGRLYLASHNDIPAGCIALRPYDDNRCEMKRLYVRPQFRGQGLARLLANKIIYDAKKVGYHQMLLDTLPTMTCAQKLYHSLGFYEISPYRFNPIEGTQYMCLDL